jgi:hypothetical protein
LPQLLIILGKLTAAYGLRQSLKRFSQQPKRKSELRGIIWPLPALAPGHVKLRVKMRAPFAGNPNPKLV